MSNKWLESEGPKWVAKKIVTQEQFQQIQALYPIKKTGIGVLPLLGGLLVTLGILSFVAANWQAIPQFARLTIILIGMLGFYWGGERLHAQGQRHLGEALIAAGLGTFGAGLFLVSQMYHISGNEALLFLLWSAAGGGLLLWNRLHLIYYFTLAIMIIGQFYVLDTTYSINYWMMALLILPGYYVWKHRNPALLFSFIFALYLHIQTILIEQDLTVFYVWLIAASMYAIGEWLPVEIRSAARRFSLVLAFVFNLWFVTFYDTWWNIEHLEMVNLIVFLPIWLLAALFTVLAKRQAGRSLLEMLEWLIFLPLFLLPFIPDYLHLGAMLLFSLSLLVSGYRIQKKGVLQAATLSFILSTLIAYFKLTWDFMDKSLFFISAGLLLWGLSWYLYRKNRQILTGTEDDDNA